MEPMIIAISVWSDIACPWCFVGKSNLEKAIRELSIEAPELQFDIRWRAFELDPRPREPSTQGYVERLAAKYQRSVAEAQQMIDTMTDAISDAGGHADFDKVIAANTFDAHRLIQWAGETDRAGETSGAQHRLTDALMRGYLGDGINLGRDEDMLSVVGSIGLDQSVAQAILASNQFAKRVRADQQLAEQYDVRGVPFFIVGGYGLSGAQPSSTLVAAIRQAQPG